jgi:hypothetical protein
MAYRSFFGDEENEFFDMLGRPKRPGIYEFQRFDGRKVIYTLGWQTQDDPEALPRLRVVRASRLEDYPSPSHALKNLDGQWIRFLGDQSQEENVVDSPN